MAKPRELRDPIHGFINRTEQEEKIIDTPVYQRLRGIKQLAMAHLVYPGAMHTRFDHSIGAMHVAGRLAQRLFSDEKEIVDITRLAVLLHDVGHGPFSHVSEDILDRYYDQSKVKPKSKEKIHELLTCDIIEKIPEISKLLSEPQRKAIVRLLVGKGEPIVRGIISGPLDADKQDYLLRDSYFCGVKYGVFDLERLIGSLEVHKDGYEQTLAASSDGVYAIEQFVLAKYHMTTQVYRHKVRLVTDAMIVRALELGLEVDNIESIKRLYSYDGSEEHIRNYLEWDDYRLICTLLYSTADGALSKNIFRKLKNRDLFKRVFSKNLLEFSDPNVRDILSNIAKNDVLRKQFEKQIAEFLSSKMGRAVNSNYVIVKAFTIKSVREQSRNNEGSIIILSGSAPKKFEDESILFHSINEKEYTQFFEVYAPVTFDDDTDKKKKRAEFDKDIYEILTKGASQELEGKKKT
jgi:HD superfamily phosphohydrolase